MLAELHTFSLVGIDALPVEVEADVSPGALPKTVLVGLPQQAVKARIALSGRWWTSRLCALASTLFRRYFQPK